MLCALDLTGGERKVTKSSVILKVKSVVVVVVVCLAFFLSITSDENITRRRRDTLFYIADRSQRAGKEPIVIGKLSMSSCQKKGPRGFSFFLFPTRIFQGFAATLDSVAYKIQSSITMCTTFVHPYRESFSLFYPAAERERELASFAEITEPISFSRMAGASSSSCQKFQQKRRRK